MVVSNDLVRFEIPTLDHLHADAEYGTKGRVGAYGRTLSSPHEKRYGCLEDTASPRTVEIWPVNESLSSPDARSQILITRSPAPVANHLFPGSTATLRTQPRCPEMTRMSFHGGWYVGLIVRVVLWSWSARVRLLLDVKVDGWGAGVLSICAIMRLVSVLAERHGSSVIYATATS